MIATCFRVAGPDWYRISDITTVLEETRPIKKFEPLDPVKGVPVTILVIDKDVLETRCIELYRP